MALYVFGIGGTGARVMKALAMLLASGAQVENTEAVIPILIDPDTGNGDLTRTLEILKQYQGIQKIAGKGAGFFGTPIRSLNELGEVGGAQDQFRFEIEGIRNHRFSEFIHRADMSRANQAMTSMLYSEGNLNTDMEVGFKGNPHIGSVVLNKMRESELFRKFAAAVNENDRVFVISSIFGGTGAAGFPLLVKNIRNAHPDLPKHHMLQNMPVGAVTVLPYFDVDSSEGNTVIDSNSFISKTKAALAYYAENLCGERKDGGRPDPRLNALYYIGDNLSNTQAGADGGTAQSNSSHFIELAAAAAVLDFMRLRPAELDVENGIVQSPKYYEFGLKNHTNNITFKDFAPRTHTDVSHTLTRYYLFLKFYQEHYGAHENQPFVQTLGIQAAQLNATFRGHLQKFNHYYEEWLAEMEKSSIHFAPLKRSVGADDLLKMVDGYEDKTGWPRTRGMAKVLEQLSTTADKVNNGDKPEAKLLRVFHEANTQLIQDRIKL